MGREIRRVPPNWEHPKDDRGNYLPMRDRTLEDRFAQWLADFDRIRCGELSEIERECYGEGNALANWLQDDGNPPDPKYYRPWSDAEATWFQVWETVSEGTPVTPPFETKQELVDYLVECGDFWDQRRGNGGHSRKAAEHFVDSGWAPSFVMGGGKMAAGIEGLELLREKEDSAS